MTNHGQLLILKKHFAWKIWDLKSSVLTGLRRKLSLLLFQKNQTSSLPTSSMPGMTGLELVKSVREQNVNCEFIIVSGHSDFSYAQEAISYGVAGYCLKPLEPQETAEALNRAKRYLNSRKTTAPELSYLDDNFESLRNYMITHFSEKLTLNLSQRNSI